MFEGENPLIEAADNISIDAEESAELGIAAEIEAVTAATEKAAAEPKLGSYERLMQGFRSRG